MIRDNSKIFKLLGELDYKKIKNSTIAVVGCGSIGSNILEYLARIGIMKLIGIDKSKISETDITCHLIALKNNLNEPKTIETKKRLFKINESIYFTPVNKLINGKNAHEILINADLVISTVPDMKVNLSIEEACSELNIPLIIANTNKTKVYITTQFPGDFNLESYAEYMDEVYNRNFSTVKLPYTVPYITSLVLREAFKILLNEDDTLRNKLLISNMENYETQIVLTDENDVEDDDEDYDNEIDENDDIDDFENKNNDGIEEDDEEKESSMESIFSENHSDEEPNEVDEILHMEM